MSDRTVHETLAGEPVNTVKTERPVGDIFTVSGEHGRVSYDQFANRIELVDAFGDIEAMGSRWANQVRLAAEDGDDAVFALLAGHYGRELAPTAAPTNPDRRCHRCGATSGLRLTFGSPLALDYKQYECADGCSS